jgi:hypothetical protein
MPASSDVASIITHLGGKDFLARLGARDFGSDDAHLSFTLAYDNPKGVHLVTITTEPRGSGDRPLLLQLQASCCIAVNRRLGPLNEPATAGARCARSGGLGEVHGSI